ncbi:polyprenyl synthetase family protein [Aciditerrimonas ferrireducens]|jgi:geranylgeranyl diphosphate synthase type I|uniref:Polyprenyl synthetase family protein n=1 Tax=Aciditerrimonas ferrireducens TaxID=667306 RepID=A0ABV6C4S3_9ACTN
MTRSPLVEEAPATPAASGTRRGGGGRGGGAGAPVRPPALLERYGRLLAGEVQAVVGRLHPAVRPALEHHFAAVGKGVRGALALLSAAAVGAPEEVAVPGAVALELVHNFSLIHDDVIDGDQERRHQPTVWAKFGLGPAIVSGDALLLAAVELLLADPSPQRVRAAAVLAQATQAMIAGQAEDMAFEGRALVSVEECLAMEAGKTGALLACAASLGAILGEGSDAQVAALAAYGAHVGIAFQAVDDVLGIWGDPTVTGKPVGSDLLARKRTLPVTIALAAGDARAEELASLLDGPLSSSELARATELLAGGRREAMAVAEAHVHNALAALADAGLVEGPAAELAELAWFVLERDR